LFKRTENLQCPTLTFESTCPVGQVLSKVTCPNVKVTCPRAKMKTIRIALEDREYKELKEIKKKLTWKELFMEAVIINAKSFI